MSFSTDLNTARQTALDLLARQSRAATGNGCIYISAEFTHGLPKEVRDSLSGSDFSNETQDMFKLANMLSTRDLQHAVALVGSSLSVDSVVIGKDRKLSSDGNSLWLIRPGSISTDYHLIGIRFEDGQAHVVDSLNSVRPVEDLPLDLFGLFYLSSPCSIPVTISERPAQCMGILFTPSNHQ